MFHFPKSWSKRWQAPSRRRPVERSVKLTVERCEDRTVPSTYTVTGTGDSGSGSGTSGDLVYCVAHATSGSDTIVFSNTTAGGATNFYDGSQHTISLTTALPTIADSVTIAGPPLNSGVPAVLIQRDTSVIGALQIFNIHNSGGGLEVTLENLEIKRGLVEGNAGNDGEGAGIQFTGASTGNALTIIGCDITGNQADGADTMTTTGGNGAGGGVFTSDVAFTMTSSEVTGNFVDSGAGTAAPGTAMGGGLYCTGGSATIVGSVIGSSGAGNSATAADLTASTTGGAAFGGGLCTIDTTLAMTDSTVTGNTATGSSSYLGGDASGGGIYHDGDSVTLTRVTISGNLAQGGDSDRTSATAVTAQGGMADGGGLAVLIPHSDETFTMTDSDVDHNDADGGSGTSDSSNVTAQGGLAFDGGMDVLTTADDGTPTADGTASGCTFASNEAIGGAGIASLTTPLGGDAYAGGLTVSILVDSTVADNSATGGIASVPMGSFGATRNPGSAFGGGFGPGAIGGHGDGNLFATDSMPDYAISNSTVAFNSATGGGDLVNSGTDFGLASVYGGGIANGNAGSTAQSIGLYSTIVAQNTTNSDDPSSPVGANAIGPDFTGCFSVDSDGHNLIGFSDGTGYDTSFVPAYSGTFDVEPNGNNDLVGPNFDTTAYDPMLYSLTNNGGLTDTLALKPGSPAIDNGDDSVTSLAYDQRGFPYVRTSGGATDVGAFEVQTPATPTVTYADTDWAGLPSGYPIADADPVAAGSQPGAIGYNCFATVTDAISHVASGGEVIVNGYDGSTAGSGVFTESVTVSSGLTMVLQYGAVSFESLTIDGVSGSTPAAAVTVTNTLAAGTGGIVFSVGGITSNGDLTIDPGTTTHRTILQGTGSAFDFDQGSLTHIGTPATAPSAGNGYAAYDYVDLYGVDAVVSGTPVLVGAVYEPGATFVNDGYVIDSYGGGTKTIIANGNDPTDIYPTRHGALVKGSGVFENPVVTENEGEFEAGDYPGSVGLGSFVLGSGGVSNLVFCINNATGAAGPTADADDHVSGWSLYNDQGNFTWSADSISPLTVGLQTLANPTTPGDDVAGTMANFDPTQSYSWEVVHWTGTYSGPTDVSALNEATVFDTSTFANTAGGHFSWQLDTAAQTLSLVYTPPPAVAAVQLNDSGSGVQSMTVTFSTAVDFAGGDAAAAFRLTNVDTGASVTLSATVSTNSLGQTVVTLTFSGDQTDLSGALLSGRYALTVVGSAVTDTNGVALDGSGTGTGNGVDYIGPTWTIG